MILLIEKYRDSVAALQQLVHASNRVIAWGAIGPAMVCAFQAGDLMAVIFGEIYRPAGLPFALLIFTLPLQLLSGHQRWTLITIGKPEGVLYCNMSGAIAAVAGSLLFVPFFGAAGAAAAGFAASMAIWCVASYLCKRYGAPLNMMAGVIRPLIAALAINWALAHFFDLSGWIEALCVLVVYYALTPVLDRKFLKELQRVAYAKKHLATS